MTLADHPGCILPRSTEIQPFGATRAAYGQNRRDFSGYFSSPQDLPRAILVGSNDTKQINMNVSHPHPTEIHPFGATNSTNSQNCLIILGLFFAIMVFKLATKKNVTSKLPHHTYYDDENVLAISTLCPSRLKRDPMC